MKTDDKYKVVFQLSNNDTFIYKALVSQLNNLLEAMDGICIEVVTHGYGIDLLLENSPFRENIRDLSSKGVAFLACENTIRAEKLDASQFINTTRIIPAGVAHIVQRQRQGWAYIKSGY